MKQLASSALRSAFGHPWLRIVIKPIGLAGDFLVCGPALVARPMAGSFLRSLHSQ